MVISHQSRVAQYLGYLSTLLLLVTLTACSSVSTQQDYDPGRNFANYHTWSWSDPKVIFSPDNSLTRNDLTTQRINEALKEQLPAKGLVPSHGTSADMRIQVTVANVVRNVPAPSYYDGPWGPGPWGWRHGPWGYGPWGRWNDPYYPDSTIQYPGILLQLDMFDGHDGKLIWRGRAAQEIGDLKDPNQRARVLSKLIQATLQKYPPGAWSRGS